MPRNRNSRHPNPPLNRNRHRSQSRNKSLCRSQKPPRRRKLHPTPSRRLAGNGGFDIIPDLKTWATNAEQQPPIEHFATFEEAKACFDELRSQPYNSEAKDLNTDGRPYAHLTLGMESKDGMSAVDILHVRAGQNYLVEDFTRMERLRSDPVVLESLSRVAKEIGFDRVRPYVMENGSYKAMPDMPFTQWENPYFTVDPPAQEQGDTLLSTSSKPGRKHETIALSLTRVCRKRGWPLTGRIMIWSTRPRWTARPRWRIFTAHSMPTTAPPTSGATAFPFRMLSC